METFRRTDYDENGEIVRDYHPQPFGSREALIHNISSFHESGVVIGDPATDDLVAILVFKSQLGHPTPYIAVFRYEEVS